MKYDENHKETIRNSYIIQILSLTSKHQTKTKTQVIKFEIFNMSKN